MAAAQRKGPVYGLCAVAWLGVSSLLAQAPRIDSLAPNQGPIAGGTTVIVSGAAVPRLAVEDHNCAVCHWPRANAAISGSHGQAPS
jgi:hypothetical protein